MVAAAIRTSAANQSLSNNPKKGGILEYATSSAAAEFIGQSMGIKIDAKDLEVTSKASSILGKGLLKIAAAEISEYTAGFVDEDDVEDFAVHIGLIAKPKEAPPKSGAPASRKSSTKPLSTVESLKRRAMTNFGFMSTMGAVTRQDIDNYHESGSLTDTVGKMDISRIAVATATAAAVVMSGGTAAPVVLIAASMGRRLLPKITANDIETLSTRVTDKVSSTLDAIQQKFDEFGKDFNEERRNEAANLHRSKISEQRNRTGIPSASPVVAPRPDDRPDTEDVISNPQVDRQVRPIEITGVDTAMVDPTNQRDAEARRVEDRKRSEEFLRQNMAAKTALPTFPTPQVQIDHVPSGGFEPGALQDDGRFQNEMRRLAAADAALPFNDMRRQLIRAQMNAERRRAANAMQEKAKKIAMKAARKTQEWIWRGASPGSSIEWPDGITVFIWSSIGWAMWMGNFVTTIFQTATKGKFIKGILSFLAPPGFDFKDPFTWGIDLIYGILAMFILLMIFLVIHLLLLLFGMILLGSMELFGWLQT